MHQLHKRYSVIGQKYSAKNNVKPIPFFCAVPEAKQVHLTGDFNDWDPAAHPMKRMPDGVWRLEIALNHGHHHYLFLVDGSPMLDPRAHGVARNRLGQRVSLIAVS